MSSHEITNDMYFTNPSELAEYCKAQNHNNMASRDDMPAYKVYYIESPKPFPKTDSKNDIHIPSPTTKKEDPNDCSFEHLPPLSIEDLSKDEYLTSMSAENKEPNDNQSVILSLSSEESIEGKYLTSMPTKQRNPNEIPPGNTEVRPKKPIVHDIYDEDNYCLARGAKFEEGNNNDDDNNSEKMTFSENKATIAIVAIVFVLAVVCGVVFSSFFLKPPGLALITIVHYLIII